MAITPTEATGTGVSDAHVSGEQLVSSLTRFSFVPTEYGQYVTDTATAAGALRTTPQAIARLATAGLPHRSSPDGPLFDYDDLMNVGMFSRSGQTIPELGLRYLMRFAAGRAESWFSKRRWRVTVRPRTRITADATESSGASPEVRVRVPLSGPGVEVELLTPESPSTASHFTEVEGGFTCTVGLAGVRQHVADTNVTAVWQETLAPLIDGSVTYQTVSEAMRLRHEQAWQAGAADCVVASRILRDRLAAQGIPAVVRRGFLLGVFGSDHAWCEAQVSGSTWHLDPIFAFVATTGSRARGVRISPEFAQACFGSRFNRLLPCYGEDGAPMVTIDGRPAPYWSLSGVSASPIASQQAVPSALTETETSCPTTP